jgi:hypothetical protein
MSFLSTRWHNRTSASWQPRGARTQLQMLARADEVIE